MIRLLLIVFISFIGVSVPARQIRLSSDQIEAMFLKQNLALIAERMNVSIADAAIAEATVWDNPELSVGDINFWKRRGTDEYGGAVASPKQFSLELSQMVSLSARRIKLAEVEKIDKEITVRQFEELLRSLKMELHISIAELVYLQNLLKVIESRQTLLEKVVAGYRAQYQTGNVTGNELLRLQTALFAVNGEMNEVRIEYNAHQKNIKNLLALEPSVVVIVAEEQVDFPSPLTLDPAMLMETALASRPDLAAAVLRAEYHRKDIVYQKALAIPDISLGVKYDRAGGVWDNFFGVGIGVQLPVFNRNKGAIRSARFRLRQNEILVLQERNNIRNEIIECLENYKAVYSFLEENGVNRSIQSEMDKMPDVYTKNLLMKNISMVEYMDFMDSYHASKEVLLRSRKELRLQFERLQFAIGQTIK